MARRRISSIEVGYCKVDVYRDSEWDQYIVRATVNGKMIGGKADGGYFTDDKQDAIATANRIADDLGNRPICRRGIRPVNLDGRRK